MGKVLEVDDGTRYRYDYVRLCITCRDVSRVPKIVEGTLGMYLMDFGFEREVPHNGGVKVLKSGIKVGDQESWPPARRTKPEQTAANQSDKGNTVDNSNTATLDNEKNNGKQVMQASWSAPPKVDPSTRGTSKFMGYAQKSYKRSSNVDDGEKVHIPDTLEDSDSDSDSFSQRLSLLAGMENVGQSSTMNSG